MSIPVIRLTGDFYSEPDYVTRGCTLSSQDPELHDSAMDVLGDKTGYEPWLRDLWPLCLQSSETKVSSASSSPTCIVIEAESASAVASRLQSLLPPAALSSTRERFSFRAEILENVYGCELRCTLKAKVVPVSAPLQSGELRRFAVQLSRRDGDGVAFGRFLARARRELLDEPPDVEPFEVQLPETPGPLQPLLEMLVSGDRGEALAALASLARGNASAAAVIQAALGTPCPCVLDSLRRGSETQLSARSHETGHEQLGDPVA